VAVVTRYTVHFSGHVQGVGFRYTVVHIARSYAAAGYVQNLSDGRVKLVAEGQPADLDSLVDQIARQMERYVTSHTLDKSAASGEFGRPAADGIAVRY